MLSLRLPLARGLAVALLGVVAVVVACSDDPPAATPTADAGIKQPDTCANGVKDANEADVDCGGACATKCGVAKPCTKGSDCVEGSCGKVAAAVEDAGSVDPSSDAAAPDASAPKVDAGPVDCTAGGCTCLAPSAKDGVKNGDETDLDCGGTSAPKCGFASACKVPADCRSAACTAGKCGPSAGDGQRDGDETDIDCGGATAPRCGTGRRCVAATDCDSLSCVSKICQKATHNDGVKNLDEVDVDCGGPDPLTPRCGVAKICVDRKDCATNSCNAATKKCQQPGPPNGMQDGDESDVDCGGTTAPPCVVGKTCGAGRDCEDGVCTGTKCVAATSTDGVKNGDESDVDCGGTSTGAPKCAVGKSCSVHADCGSDGCGYNRKCVSARSCTQLHGGATCGSGEYGQPGAAHESCCTTVNVTDPGAPGGGYIIDKYQITAGRMRQFIERTNGNVLGYIQANRPANWDPAWDAWVPKSMDGDPGALGAGPTEYALKATSAYHQLAYTLFFNQGGTQGCWMQGTGTHTYWMSDTIQSIIGDIPFRNPQDTMDEKSLNCVSALMVAAFCKWDGGRPAKIEELDFLWKGTYPWGNAPTPAGYNLANGQKSPASGDLTVANYLYAYQYPLRAVGNDPDYGPFVAPPGRFPNGAGKNNVMDLGGNLFEVTYITGGITGANPQNRSNRWSRNGSFEGHGIPYPAISLGLLHRYGKVGGRCVRSP